MNPKKKRKRKNPAPPPEVDEYAWLDGQKSTGTSGNPNGIPAGLDGISQFEEYTIASSVRWFAKHCSFMRP